MTSSLLPGDGIGLRRCRHLHGPGPMHGPTTVQGYCAACDSSRSCAKSSVASCQGRATTVNRSNDVTCRPLSLVNFHGECFCVIITTENILTVHRSRCHRALFNMHCYCYCYSYRFKRSYNGYNVNFNSETFKASSEL